MKQKTESGGIFALPTNYESSKIILTSVPWEVTTSYGSGTSLGPKAILDASPQVDLYDIETRDAWRSGYHLEPEDSFFSINNDRLKVIAQKIVAEWDEKGELSEATQKMLHEVNAGCEEMVRNVASRTEKIMADGKIPGLIGGDHSTPLGAIQTIAKKLKGNFGVLHIDAHADLRLAYQGFTQSHASIMRNVCLLDVGPKTLVQVGIRDFCKEEFDFIEDNKGRIFTHFDNRLKNDLFAGIGWKNLCESIIEPLPEEVYVSFDIDGLSPEFCPHTGTPVPGGLSFDQATYLLNVLAKSGRRIVGFDLNEVAPGPDSQWDGNVGARLLFKLCGWAAVTNGYSEN